MGEKDKILSKLIDKAGEQGFTFIVMAFVCWVMYSMITQNNENTIKEIEQLKEDYKDCILYNRNFLEQKLRDK